jgi:hypothetical protein
MKFFCIQCEKACSVNWEYCLPCCNPCQIQYDDAILTYEYEDQ